jgi:hypothetical protein
VDGSGHCRRQAPRITGFDDLADLVEKGYVTSFSGSNGLPNGFIAGLMPTNLIINCPVIAQPAGPARAFQPVKRSTPFLSSA